MTVIIDGTTGITSDGGYAGDGVSFADGTPSNTLVTTTGGNVGIGTSSPGAKFDVTGTTWVRGGQKVAGYFSPLAGDGYNLTFVTSGTTGYVQSYNGTATNALSIDGSSISFRTGTFTTAATIDSSGNLQFNSGYGSVATAYGCRAWVNFNGTGTVAIRASGNVSSITDNGTGDYTVNFKTAMPDANYCIQVATGRDNSVNEAITNYRPDGVAAGSIRVMSQNRSAVMVDPLSFSVSIFR